MGPRPAPRREAKVATLPDGSGMILFGGLGTQFYNDLWVLRFSDLSWEELHAAGTPPSPRFRHTLVMDEAGNRLWVAFGSGSGGQFTTDVWELDLDGLIPPPPFVRGDINGDGTVNIADPVFLLSSLFVARSDQPTCRKAADVNDDGGLDISDAVFEISCTAACMGPPACPIAPIPGPTI